MNTHTHGLLRFGAGLLLATFFCLPTAIRAQYATPTINADLGSNEYGGTNNESGGFHVTWDATYLYVYLPSTNTGEACVIYLDFDVPVPINGGTNASGNLNGFPYDQGSGSVVLPMRADAAIYVKDSYREIRKADGSGGWSTISSGNNGLSGSGSDDYSNGDLSVDGGNSEREFRIRWNHLNSGLGIPSKFAWVAHAVSSSGFIYRPSPATGNPTGNFNNTQVTFSRYLQIASTANGSSTPFKSRECYTHSGGSIADFGAIDVFDFTMNTAGATITRNTASGGTWLIVGSLIVGNGATVNFGSGSTYGDTDIWGSIQIFDNSTVDMNNTNKPAQVGFDVIVHESTGTFSLSNTVGGDVEIGRNFQNDGTFNCRERAVILNGTGAQTISGDQAISIDYLIVNNTGSGVTLSREVTVGNKLDLIDGIVYTSSANKLVMIDIAEMDGTNSGSNASHVDGPMRKTRASTAAFTFPIGKGGLLRAASVTPTSAASTTFTAEYMAQAPSAVPYNPASILSEGANTLQNVLDTEYWLISRDAGTADAAVTLTWNNASGVSNVTDLRVAHWNGSAWHNQGAAGATGDTNSGTITSDAFTSFSPVGFGEITTPAPISLLHFDAAPHPDGGVLLQWATASEIDNSHFVLQRSADGLHFEPIGQVAGQGQSESTMRYAWRDREPLRGTAYYRIQDVDFEGNAGYSPVVQVQAGESGQLRLTVAGPAGAPKALRIANASSQAIWAIYDLQGRPVAQGRGPEAVVSLPQGLYVVKISDGKHAMAEKVVF